MEPLNDRELDQLLKQWSAPAAPPGLTGPVGRPWWSWLLRGTIRIPVPVGAALLIVVALWAYWRESGTTRTPQPAVKAVSLGDFQPVTQLEPRVVGRANEGN